MWEFILFFRDMIYHIVATVDSFKFNIAGVQVGYFSIVFWFYNSCFYSFYFLEGVSFIMSVLTILEWLVTSNCIITTVFLLMFGFGLLFSLLRGVRR